MTGRFIAIAGESSTLESVTVESVQTSNVSDTAADLEGELTSLGGATEADVYMEYREEGAKSWQMTSVTTVSSTGTFTRSLSGLTQGMTYEWRAVAEGSNGTTDRGDILTFVATTAALAVSTVEARDVGRDHATLVGDITDLGQYASAEAYFEYRDPDATITDSIWFKTADTSKSSTGEYTHHLGDLTADETYEFRAVAAADGAVRDVGSAVSFTTGVVASGGTIGTSTDTYEGVTGTASLSVESDHTAHAVSESSDTDTNLWAYSAADGATATGSNIDSLEFTYAITGDMNEPGIASVVRADPDRANVIPEVSNGSVTFGNPDKTEALNATSGTNTMNLGLSDTKQWYVSWAIYVSDAGGSADLSGTFDVYDARMVDSTGSTVYEYEFAHEG